MTEFERSPVQGPPGCKPISAAEVKGRKPIIIRRPAVSFNELPKTYTELVAMMGSPRVISDSQQYDAVFKVVAMMVGHDMTDDQSDYLETLQMMVERWEAENCEISKEV